MYKGGHDREACVTQQARRLRSQAHLLGVCGLFHQLYHGGRTRNVFDVWRWVVLAGMPVSPPSSWQTGAGTHAKIQEYLKCMHPRDKKELCIKYVLAGSCLKLAPLPWSWCGSGWPCGVPVSSFRKNKFVAGRRPFGSARKLTEVTDPNPITPLDLTLSDLFGNSPKEPSAG